MLESVVGSRLGSRVIRWKVESSEIPRCIGLCTGLSSKTTTEKSYVEIRIISITFDQYPKEIYQHTEDLRKDPMKKTPYNLVLESR